MIEIAVKDFLEQRLSAPIYMEYPEKPPERFVVLKKDGGPRENLIDSAMLVVDSYAGSTMEAAKLNEEVKVILDDLTQLDTIVSSRRSGDYPFFDTKNKRHRYQAAQNITHY